MKQFLYQLNKRSHNSLISLSLIKNGIRSIHEQEFADWPYLRIVSLSHNYIKLLNRKWFSTTLKDLWSLDLSYNKIVSLSQDFFSGMTSLRKLRLDNNKLMFLPFDPIEIIWKNGLLNQFFINSESSYCRFGTILSCR
jgi:Leucine-rich repeat (LRR) protein